MPRSFTPTLLEPDIISYIYGDCWDVHVYPQSLQRTLVVLRDHPDAYFKQLIDLTAIDYPNRTQRFDIVYHLLSHAFNMRLRLRVRISEGDSILSVSSVFPNASWYEREVYDLFGIIFDGHPDMRRILTDYDFEGHPLRKDFPLSGHAQVVFDESLGKIVQEPTCLRQEYRDFDFMGGPWKGGLPGDEKAKGGL